MARSYGKVHASLVTDDEFNDLCGDEGYLYFRLCGHPKLSLVGCIDYRPHHWAKYARNWDREFVEALVVELEVRRYFAVDRDTEELLIRTLTKHDGIPIGNVKLRKGLWAQWSSIASPDLRRVAVRNMPEALFDYDDAPEAAVKIRRSLQLDPLSDHLPDYLMRDVSDNGIGHLPDSPASYHLPLDTSTTAAGSDRCYPEVGDKPVDNDAGTNGSLEEVSTHGN